MDGKQLGKFSSTEDGCKRISIQKLFIYFFTHHVEQNSNV